MISPTVLRNREHDEGQAGMRYWRLMTTWRERKVRTDGIDKLREMERLSVDGPGKAFALTRGAEHGRSGERRTSRPEDKKKHVQ